MEYEHQVLVVALLVPWLTMNALRNSRTVVCCLLGCLNYHIRSGECSGM